MVKFFGYLFILLLLAAVITAPSSDKFRSFANNQVDTTTCKPFVEYEAYKILFTVCGVGHLRACKETRRIYDPKTGTYLDSKSAIPVYGEQQTYLGLFGRFWKL